MNSASCWPPWTASSWRARVESIIETGRRLIEVRDDRFKDDRGKWSQLIGDHGHKPVLPFAKTHAYRLIAIAEDARLFPHGGTLPSDHHTLYQITRLSDERFTERLEAGRINPSMKRNEASAWTRQESRQRTGQVSLCLFAEHPDRLTVETPTPRLLADMTPQCSPWGPAAEL